MEMENRFSSIFKETESNLARVKERLDASRNQSMLTQSLCEPSFHQGITENGSSRFTSSLQLYTSPLKPVVAPSWSGNNKLSSLTPFTTTNGHARLHNMVTSDDVPLVGPSLDQSAGLVTLLSDKIDAQNRTIETLTQAVRNLEEERHTHSQQVTRLREEVSQLSARIAERGVHVQTERKVEAWQSEVMTQLQLVQSELSLSKQVQQRAESNIQQNSQLSAVLRELQDLKKYMKEETGEMRNTVENLKSRMVLLEVDLHQSQSNSKGLHHRQDVLDRSLRDVLTTQNSASRDLSAVLETSRDLKDKEISQFRSSLRDLSEKLRKVENQVHRSSASSSQNPKMSTARSPKSTNAQLDAEENFDLSDVELDLTPDLSDDVDTEEDGRKAGLGDYDDLDLDNLTPDELTANDLDDIKTKDLDDVHTADTIDLNLTADDLHAGDDLVDSDEDLSIDHLQ